MDSHTLQEIAKGWLHPPHPGKGKNPVIGFVLGFFLGVFGVGIYLRSLTEFACCLIAVMLLMPFLFGVSSLLLPVFCGLWVVGRILWDNRQAHEQLIQQSRQPVRLQRLRRTRTAHCSQRASSEARRIDHGTPHSTTRFSRLNRSGQDHRRSGPWAFCPWPRSR